MSLLAAAMAGLVSAGLTGIVRRYALQAGLFDIPNERSSHSLPTPRGGGIAIVVATIGGFAAGSAAGWLDVRLSLAIAGGGSLVAAVGLLDDHRDVRPGVRMAIHLAAAIWALYLLGGVPTLRIGSAAVHLGSMGWLLGAVGIVWMVNLYNFMDGIDGIAAGEAVSVAVLGAVLAALTDAAEIRFASLMLAAAAAGFVVWNWAPARIFMGDVGSGFLGFAFIVIALASEATTGPPLLIWLMLLGVFVFDTTVTLVRRVVRGDRWFSAHRLHAYQRAVQAGWSHRLVAGCVLLINMGLGLLAMTAVFRPNLLPYMLAAAVAALMLIYVRVEYRLPMGKREGRTPSAGSNPDHGSA